MQHPSDADVGFPKGHQAQGFLGLLTEMREPSDHPARVKNDAVPFQLCCFASILDVDSHLHIPRMDEALSCRD